MPEYKIRKDNLVDTILSCCPDVAMRKKETVDDFAQDLFSYMDLANYNPGTIRNYTFMYDKFIFDTIKNTDIHKSMQNDINQNLDLLYSYGFTYEYRTIARTVFNHIFNYAIALGYITENPCFGIKLRD